MGTKDGVANATLVIVVASIVFVIGSWVLFNQGWPNEDVEPKGNAGESTLLHSPEESNQYTVTVNRPAPPRVLTGQVHPDGQPVTVACSACHSVRPPNRENHTAADLNEFHGGMTFSHGNTTCLSCHNPTDYDSLRLANGQSVSFPDVMTLCGQCHAQQMRDYEHGAHGGMNGYWDLSKGPRTRKNCTECHDPHAPGFPLMNPTFKPRDRFLAPQKSGEHGHG